MAAGHAAHAQAPDTAVQQSLQMVSPRTQYLTCACAAKSQCAAERITTRTCNQQSKPRSRPAMYLYTDIPITRPNKQGHKVSPPKPKTQSHPHSTDSHPHNAPHCFPSSSPSTCLASNTAHTPPYTRTNTPQTNTHTLRSTHLSHARRACCSTPGAAPSRCDCSRLLGIPSRCCCCAVAAPCGCRG